MGILKQGELFLHKDPYFMRILHHEDLSSKRIIPLKKPLSHEDPFHMSTNPPKRTYSPLNIASMRTFLHEDLYLKRTIPLSELLLPKDSYLEVAS